MHPCIFIFVLIFLNGNNCEHSVVFEKVERTIDLRSHRIEARHKIDVKNGQTHALSSLQMVFKRALCEKIFFISAHQNEKQITVNPHHTETNSSFCFYTLKLSKNIEKESTETIELLVIFSERFIPDPPKAKQSSEHIFIFYDDMFFSSIYEVRQQSAEFKVRRSWVKDYTKSSQISIQENAIKITIDENSQPFNSKDFFIRFSYPEPIPVFSGMFKRVQVSEWGAISTLNRFWLRNDAAELDGVYSRLHDQNNKDSHAIYDWKMRIPLDAYNVYYRDGLGNVSTSSVEREDDYISLTLQPRYPIFGGWRTYYYVSYYLPPKDNLFILQKDYSTTEQKRVLKFNLLGHPMPDFVIENAEIVIRLPEGAQDISIKSDKFDIKNVVRKVEYSYLDFTGRPVLEFVLKRVVTENDAEIEIFYTYNSAILIRKPLIISTTLFVLLLSLLFVLRIEKPVLSSIKDKEAKNVAELVETVQITEKKIRKLFDSRMEAISAYKIDKNINNLRSASSRIIGQLEKSQGELLKVWTKLTEFDQKYLEIAAHYKSKNIQRADFVEEYEDLSKKVVDGKISRDVYAQSSHSLEDKVQDAHSTIQNIIMSL